MCCSGHDDQAARDDPRQQVAPDRPGERQDQQDAEDVGDEAGAEHQRPAERDERAVGQLAVRQPAGLDPLAQRLPGAGALTADQPRPDDAVQDQQPDRRQDPDPAPHLDDHVELDHRHHDEDGEERQGHPATSSPHAPDDT